MNSTTTSVLKYRDGDSEKNKQDTNNNISFLNLSGAVSIGGAYEISNKMNVTVQPTFNHGLFRIIDAPLSARLWSYGINLGFYYRLRE